MAQSRHKSYVDVRRRELEFAIDYWVYMKISPMKGVMRFELASVHLVFHVSLLKKFIGALTSIVPLESVGVKSLSYEEVLVDILDCQFPLSQVSKLQVSIERIQARISTLGMWNFINGYPFIH
ncbi:hypothetical protein MTR67_034324 [Solanum verrucosum]|uniref:Uncharacterized protein n=1 Tax=Solanum verrucosum TaxID=315347 RepID=A0AAF0ZL74_SOLVR|nr:hypothetical protein MTR67_034324 [Solanum verrucosum]